MVESANAIAAAKREYRERRRREKVFAMSLFGEPVWDILLDLFISEAEKREVYVTSACIAANIPATTALRYIAFMEQEGLVQRVASKSDRRKLLISLTSDARGKLVRHFTLQAAKAPAPFL